MIVAEDGIHFVERDLVDPSLDLAGLAFFNSCLVRVTDTFLAASDNVMLMGTADRTAPHPEAADPKRSERTPRGRSRLLRALTTRVTDYGHRIWVE